MLAKKVANGLFSLNLEHLKDGAAGDELLFELHSAVVGTNEDGEEVSGGLVIETDIRPPAAAAATRKEADRAPAAHPAGAAQGSRGHQEVGLLRPRNSTTVHPQRRHR